MRETQKGFIVGGVVMCCLISASGCGDPNNLAGDTKEAMKDLKNNIRELCSLEYMENTPHTRIAEDLEILYDIVKGLENSKTNDNTCFKNRTLLNNIKSITDEIGKKRNTIKDKVEKFENVLGTKSAPDKHKAESTTRLLTKVNQMLNAKFNENIKNKNQTLDFDNVDFILSYAKSFAYFYVTLSETSSRINLKTVYSRCGDNEVVANTYKYISEQIKKIEFYTNNDGWNIDFSCLILKTGLPGDHFVNFVIKTIINAKTHKEIIEKLHLNDSPIIGSPNPINGIIKEMKKSKSEKIDTNQVELYNKILERESTKAKILAIYNTILKQVKLNIVRRIRPFQQMICKNYPALLSNKKADKKHSTFCNIFSEGLELLSNNSNYDNISNNFLGINNELWNKDYWDHDDDKTVLKNIDSDNGNFNMKILTEDQLCSPLLDFSFEKLKAFGVLLSKKENDKFPYGSEYILSKGNDNNKNYVIQKDKEQFMKEALKKFKKTKKGDDFFYKPLSNFYTTILRKDKENNKRIEANKMSISTIAESNLGKYIDIFASLNK